MQTGGGELNPAVKHLFQRLDVHSEFILVNWNNAKTPHRETPLSFSKQLALQIIDGYCGKGCNYHGFVKFGCKLKSVQAKRLVPSSKVFIIGKGEIQSK